jgi:hypothetical protein
MGWRVCVVTFTIGIFFSALFFGGAWLYTMKENKRYSEASCMIRDYSFVPLNGTGCARSWVNVVTADGAALIYAYDPCVTDVDAKNRYYALYYPTGRTSSCWISSEGWTWFLANEFMWMLFFIIWGSVDVLFIFGWIIGGIISHRRKRNAVIMIQTDGHQHHEIHNVELTPTEPL